jgi:hypothetical protein
MTAINLFGSQQVRYAKAEPFKQRLAAAGYQRVQETAETGFTSDSKALKYAKSSPTNGKSAGLAQAVILQF